MEQLTIKTRPRNTQEVTSLGFLVGKKYFFPLWITTVAAMLPFLLLSLLTILMVGENAWAWGIFVLWVGKPYFERPALLVLSRLIFNEKWRLGDIKRDLKKSLTGQLWLYLIFRFGARISHAAVHLLENLDGKNLKQRLKYINKKSHLGSIIIGLSFIETAFVVSLLIFVFSFLPKAFDNQNLFSLSWVNILLYFLIFLAFSVSNVFFTAICFMDYLNQRIISEGWAIALDLQTLIKRLTVIVLLAVVGFLPHAPAQAFSINSYHSVFFSTKESILPNGDKKDFYRSQRLSRDSTLRDLVSRGFISSDLIFRASEMRDFLNIFWQNVFVLALTSPDLDDKRFLEEKAHDPKVTPFAEKRRPVKKDSKLGNLFNFHLGNMSQTISTFIRVLVILSVVGALAWLALLIWRGQKLDNTPSPNKKKLSSLEIENESCGELINNPAQKARELLNAGKETEALSLLYQASLQKLTAEFALFVEKGDSDRDCLQNARPLVPTTVLTFLEKLISYWQKAAYGGNPPPQEAVAQCIDEFTRLWA